MGVCVLNYIPMHSYIEAICLPVPANRWNIYTHPHSMTWAGTGTSDATFVDSMSQQGCSFFVLLVLEDGPQAGTGEEHNGDVRNCIVGSPRHSLVYAAPPAPHSASWL